MSRSEYHIKASDVDKAVANVRKVIPPKDALLSALPGHISLIMPVKEIPKPDFTTTDREKFSAFLEAYSINTVMYHYEYYSEKQLDLMLKMPDAGINLFQSHPFGNRNLYTGFQSTESDYQHYLQYTAYLKKAIDPEYPWVLSLYAFCRDLIFECRTEDHWLLQTGLPTAQTIMQDASKNNHGSIVFDFTDPNAKPENREPAEKKEIAQPPEQRENPDDFYQRILRNINLGRPQ